MGSGGRRSATRASGGRSGTRPSSRRACPRGSPRTASGTPVPASSWPAAPDQVAVQRDLGHRDVTTTMNVYAGLFPNRLDEIATALDGLYRTAQSAG